VYDWIHSGGCLRATHREMRLLRSSSGAPCPFALPSVLPVAGRMAQMRTYLS